MKMYLVIKEDIDATLEALRAGYGGLFTDSLVGDRRLYRNLKPIPADPSLNIPEPKHHSLNCKNGTIFWIDSTGKELQKQCEWCASIKEHD